MISNIKAVNLLLYIKYDSLTQSICKYNNILCFNNEKIIAVDEFEYNREQRYNLQEQFGIRPYYISQRIFHEILIETCMKKTEIILRNIIFKDEAVTRELEYEDLEELIGNGDYNLAYKTIISILEEYDTEIKNININYRGYDFKITNKGVIETVAPRDTITSLAGNNKFNKVILGIG